MAKFLIFGKFQPGKDKKVFEAAKKAKPPEGITVEGLYAVCGRWDAVCIFEAADENLAREFAYALRSIDGVIDSEAFMLVPPP